MEVRCWLFGLFVLRIVGFAESFWLGIIGGIREFRNDFFKCCFSFVFYFKSCLFYLKVIYFRNAFSDENCKIRLRV